MSEEHQSEEAIKHAQEEHAQKLTEAELTLDLVHAQEQLLRFGMLVRHLNKEQALEWLEELCEKGIETLRNEETRDAH